MAVSKRFLSLLQFQLAQFADRPDVTSLVVYVAAVEEGKSPQLLPVGQWPMANRTLAAVALDNPLTAVADLRRWLPLRHGGVLLGALQVDTAALPWPEPLRQRLQAVALCLTEGLCLDLEQQRLQQQLLAQHEQLTVLLHQLRNPLAALRTFGQLLLRRLDGDERNRPLVEGLLQEERQLQRYVDAIDRLGGGNLEPAQEPGPGPLLLPPSLGGSASQPLADLLERLVQRACATAALQGRPWQGPQALPQWQGDSGAVAEIVANLLENAFRYSPSGSAVGLQCRPTPAGGWQLVVWDGGPPIPAPERQRIFRRGERGTAGAAQPGSGLGLALAADLARHLGGELVLCNAPADLDPALPAHGNAFCLSLPAPAAPAP
ncbi:HAMP domain-containing histidine kinase [Cyanobium sp. LEGE 06143]|uniref:sensor histidine kinase n=1 Tax=Cyanobium sp. LEGE 06143 TaxID=945727 RepID=UPI0018816C6B|nr:HAMP domain-containing sensor histidine kinase [Cyanobium sp. LEGE 06143]MBE9172610.1 HAMP domain-containing histidine kinase [Cyanobium sp. LEGE 06143]